MLSRLSARIWLVILLGLGAVACSRTLSTEDLLGRAQESMNSGNLNATIIDTKVALQQDADNPLGRRLLGEAYYRQRQLEDAALELERSLASSPNPDVAALYAEVLLASGQARRVVELQQDGFFDNAAGNAVFIAALARAQAMTGDTFTAEYTLEEARALAPDSREVLLAEAVFIARHTGDLEQSEQLSQRLVEAFPEYDEGWSFYGNLALARRDLSTAETALARAVELNPYRADDRLLLVNVLLDRGHSDRAGQQLQYLVRAAPEYPGVLYAQARLQLGDEDTKAALETLQKLLAAQPGHVPGLYLAGVANVREGNLATAHMQLSRFLSEQPRHVNARLLQANIDLQQGDNDLARAVAREILEDDPENMSARNLLAASAVEPSAGAGELRAAHVAMQQDDPAQARVHFARALELDPRLAAAREGLTALAMQDNDPDAALANINEGLQLQPDNLPGLLNLAAVHAQSGEYEMMVTALQRAVAAHPTAPEPRLVLARYLLQQEELAEAESLLLQLPENTQALSWLAQIERRRNQPQAAEAYLRRLLELQPDAIAARKLLVESLILQGKVQEAGEQFAEFPEGTLSGAELQVVQGRIAVSQGDMEKGEALMREAHARSPGSVSLRQLAAFLWEQAEKPEEAFAVLESWRERHPEDVLVLHQLASYYLSGARQAEAREVYEALYQLVPEDITVLNNLAWTSRQSDPGHALDLVEQALALAPANVDILDTKAMILLEQGAHREALAVNQLTLDASPDRPDLRLHQAQILAAAGDSAAAVAVLERLWTDDTGVGHAEAEALLQSLRDENR